MKLFGDLHVRLDPWQVDYGAELPVAPEDEASPDEAIILDVEAPPGQWAPIAPVSADTITRLVFVDGVRRIEARLIVRRGERICHGAFGSYAVGSVSALANVATCGEPHIDRIVAIGSGERLPEAVAPLPTLVYRPVSTASPDPDGPLRAMQDEMRGAEERLGRELANADDTLVVADGPLTFEQPLRGAAVGYIKRLFKLYLPAEKLGLMARLGAGERTPIFALRSSHRFARYSWFLRLAPAGPGDSELAGIVRLEVAETVGVDAARRLADATALMLPRFAPRRWRDPRSPQNLLPIGALESQLRRHLGDPRLIRRHIETLITEEARHAGR
ncbi:MAG TPA: hypothetical protein VFB15_13485 [Candidatus Binataceae bacterium]|nr:hypothetical protein [Candidatus Binataceae bacterium]